MYPSKSSKRVRTAYERTIALEDVRMHREPRVHPQSFSRPSLSFVDLLYCKQKKDNNTSLGYENKCQVFGSRLTSLSDGWPLWWQAAKLSLNQSSGLSGSWNHHPSNRDDACSDCDYLTTMHVDALDKLGIHKTHTGSIPSPLLSSSARLRYWTTVWRGGLAPLHLVI